MRTSRCPHTQAAILSLGWIVQALVPRRDQTISAMNSTWRAFLTESSAASGIPFSLSLGLSIVLLEDMTEM